MHLSNQYPYSDNDVLADKGRSHGVIQTLHCEPTVRDLMDPRGESKTMDGYSQILQQ